MVACQPVRSAALDGISKVELHAPLFFLAAFFIASSSSLAHDVIASTVEVHVKDNRVEILQITPRRIAHSIASSSNESGQSVFPETSDRVLTAIAKQWRVHADSADCRLQRQAYRNLDHAQLQLRYLFACEIGVNPTRLVATWLLKAPEDHFLVFTINAERKSDTVIFQRQDLIIDLSAIG